MVITGGSNISIPALRPYNALQKEMKQKVEQGEYLLGGLVVPKECVKLVLASDENIQKKTYTMHARKIDLDDIRRKTFKSHRELGKYNNESSLVNGV